MKQFGSPRPGVQYVDRPGAYALLTDQNSLLAVVETANGRFLPGGGSETGEDALTTLKREVFEEIGYTILSAEFLFQAIQYHWSQFYQADFRKIGSFYRVQASAPPAPLLQAGHRLIWLTNEQAQKQLTQEFQRWAVAEAGTAKAGSDI